MLFLWRRDMETLRVTVVGKDLFKTVQRVFELVGLNEVKQVNNGMLGNLTLLTYAFDISDEKLIEMRKKLMNELAKESMHLLPMYVHGDWLRIFVFKPMQA